MVQFTIYLFAKHVMYSPLIRTLCVRVLTGDRWHFQVGNWGKFNEGTIFRVWGLRENRKGWWAFWGLQHRELWPPLGPRIREESSYWAQGVSLAVREGTCRSHGLIEGHSQPSATRKGGAGGKHLTSLLILYFSLLTLAPPGEEKSRESIWRDKWKLLLLYEEGTSVSYFALY